MLICHICEFLKSLQSDLDIQEEQIMGNRGGGVYISGGAIALIIIVVLLIWVF
jgi:hypothetical protein